MYPSSTTITSLKRTVCLAALSIDPGKKWACSYVLMTRATERLENEAFIYCVSVNPSMALSIIRFVHLRQLSSERKCCAIAQWTKARVHRHLFRLTTGMAYR